MVDVLVFDPRQLTAFGQRTHAEIGETVAVLLETAGVADEVSYGFGEQHAFAMTSDGQTSFPSTPQLGLQNHGGSKLPDHVGRTPIVCSGSPMLLKHFHVFSF